MDCWFIVIGKKAVYNNYEKERASRLWAGALPYYDNIMRE